MNWRRFFQRVERNAELRREIQAHLDEEIEDCVARGMSAEEAHAAARKKFGNPTLIREAIYHSSSVGFLESISRDLLYALRTMRRNPIFVATTVLTLGLAIGGNTAMFTLIRAVLLKPLPYRDPGQLIRSNGGATPTRFAEMQTGARSIAELGAYTGQENLTLSGSREPEVLKGVHVSASFLPILGVNPLYGRGFRASEDSPAGTAVAMISAELWQRRFGGNPNIVGQAVILDAVPYTIIGVLPQNFQFPFPGLDVWLTAPSGWTAYAAKSRALSPFLTIFGRLDAGVSLEQADAKMRLLRHQYATGHPAMLDAKPKTPVEVLPMKDELVAKVRAMLWMLFGAVGFVLLIACANVASLLLARATARTREFAVRSALGAARTRLLTQLLTESILLSTIGGVVGVALAAFGLRAMPSMTAFQLPRVAEIHIDWVVLGFAATLSLATGILFGLAPSLGASRPDLMHVLRAGGQLAQGVSTSVLGRGSIRSFLSIGQVALSMILLVGAALLMESVSHLRRVEVGFNPANLLTVSVSLPPLRYDSDRKAAAFFAELCHRLQLLPGIRDAAAAMSLPMMGYAGSPVQDAAKPRLPLNQRLIAKIFPVTPTYFHTLEIPLKRGREFMPQDTPDAPRVAIINESLARRFWPGYPAGQDPIGQRLLIGGVNSKPAEIVGIAGDIHQNLDNRADWQESVYISFGQDPPASAMLALRVAGKPLTFTQAVRRQVQSLDRDQPIGEPSTMEQRMDAQVGQRRLLMAMLGAFALVALLLALIGIYGVIAYSVAQRVQEIGVRRALGAQQSDILRHVIGQGVGLAAIGILVGLAGSIALTRVIQALLFGVSATDPKTLGSVAVIFFLVALIASYVPARRATRIDPIAALRI